MRVLLIDDHVLFRAGLQGLLERRGIVVCGAAGDGRTGQDMATQLSPDVILLDLRMPDMSGLQVLRNLRSAGFTTPIVMLTTSDDERDLVLALRNGAQGYLLKDMQPQDLVDRLHDILAGKTVVAPDLTGALARIIQSGEAPSREPTSPFAALTPRETEILHHLADGQSNKVIARELGISDGTVKLHVKAILRKLCVHSRVEAAVLAVERGLARHG
ncbi:response regulator [Ectothiorhodospiraceae bacterium 2226]|nr:response regulator [Ectothiorhodospiraceae bacterium 2226]